MISQEQKFRLGVFLTISILLLVGLLAVLIIPKLQDEGDRYFINFKGTSVNGMSEGADVKYQGVKIGKVEQLVVNSRDLDSVLVYVRLQKAFPVKEDMRAALQYVGITGMRFVEISGGKTTSNFILPGGEIYTKKGLGERAEDIVLNVDSVVDAVNQILNKENRANLAQTLKNIEASTRSLATVLEARETKMASAIEKLDTVMTHMVELSTNLNALSLTLKDQMEKVSLVKLAKDSELMLEEITKRFSKDELGQVLKKADTFFENAAKTVRSIEVQFGSMEGEFSNTLINLRESIENLAHFTRLLSEDPTSLIRKPAEKKRSRK